MQMPVKQHVIHCEKVYAMIFSVVHIIIECPCFVPRFQCSRFYMEL